MLLGKLHVLIYAGGHGSKRGSEVIYCTCIVGGTTAIVRKKSLLMIRAAHRGRWPKTAVVFYEELVVVFTVRSTSRTPASPSLQRRKTTPLLRSASTELSSRELKVHYIRTYVRTDDERSTEVLPSVHRPRYVLRTVRSTRVSHGSIPYVASWCSRPILVSSDLELHI